MNIKLNLGLLLVLCVAGCASIRTTTLHCASLSHKEQGLVFSDLNRLLVSNGFKASSPSEVPWGMAWSNWTLSPLWKGRADFEVGASTNSAGTEIDILYYRGERNANKAVVDAIVACVQSNAPSAQVKIKASTELAPSFMGE
ncbi:MAG TPA: hypothetical protein VGI88_01650 [Verrucomicrobiae bacterium]|jgi:hypothetical protein